MLRGAARRRIAEKVISVPSQQLHSSTLVGALFEMCRNIKTLFNFEPPASEEDVKAASLQFVRKISGFNKPSHANESAFESAVAEVARASNRLLRALETTAPPKDRQAEAARAKTRALKRFGSMKVS